MRAYLIIFWGKLWTAGVKILRAWATVGYVVKDALIGRKGGGVRLHMDRYRFGQVGPGGFYGLPRLADDGTNQDIKLSGRCGRAYVIYKANGIISHTVIIS
jgi:hypothetical protein